MNRLVIIGASGHGKVVADIAEKNGYTDIVFIDDNETLKECAGLPVIGTTALIPSLLDSCDFIVAIGNAQIHQRIQETLGDHVVTLFHPNTSISRRVTIGKGTVVMAGAVINPDATLGEGCIVNTGASIYHDCQVGDYAHISVGAHLAGTVHLGARSWVGIGACVNNNTTICDDCMIGAGAIAIRDIEKPSTYMSALAKRKKSTHLSRPTAFGSLEQGSHPRVPLLRSATAKPCFYAYAPHLLRLSIS